MKAMANRTMMAAALAVMAVTARGGSLDSPAAPTSPDSAMVTLDDVYNKLNDRATVVTKRSGAFEEPTAGPTAGTMHTLNEIMTLVTNRAPVPITAVTTSDATGDDGDVQMGVRWPNPRFTVGTGAHVDTVRDNLTGLVWTRHVTNACAIAGAGTATWANALTACNDLTYGGYDDWRLPNVREFLSLFDYRWQSPALSDTSGTVKYTAILGPWWDAPTVSRTYWTSTRYSSANAWNAAIHSGATASSAKTTLYYVWPVRGGGK